MASVEQAVQWMIDIANDNSHGYSQSRRWGPDYDCSSLTIQAFKNAGFDVGAATYTGNIRRVFQSAGFAVLGTNVAKQRGDILLNDVNHVAVYLGSNQIVQASSDEYGGIAGPSTGDQTGREIAICGYYNYPWNCVLRYTGAQSTPAPSAPHTPSLGFDVYYRVRTAQDGWLPEVKNLEDFAGIKGHAITDVAIRVGAGSLWYQVHDRGSNWWPKVSGCNINDNESGYAGNGNPIDLLRCYLYSPNGDKVIKYRVAPIGQGYFDWQRDDEGTNGQDGFAGDFWLPIDRLQIAIADY